MSLLRDDNKIVSGNQENCLNYFYAASSTDFYGPIAVQTMWGIQDRNVIEYIQATRPRSVLSHSNSHKGATRFQKDIPNMHSIKLNYKEMCDHVEHGFCKKSEKLT